MRRPIQEPLGPPTRRLHPGETPGEQKRLRPSRRIIRSGFGPTLDEQLSNEVEACEIAPYALLKLAASEQHQPAGGLQED